MKRLPFGLVLIAALSAACASRNLTPEQREREERIKQRERDEKSAPGWVNVTRNADEVRGCKSLGLVTGSGSDVLGTGRQNAIEKLQERVARKGGNTLLLGQLEQAQGDGEAYDCPEPTPTPRPAP